MAIMSAQLKAAIQKFADHEVLAEKSKQMDNLSMQKEQSIAKLLKFGLRSKRQQLMWVSFMTVGTAW